MASLHQRKSTTCIKSDVCKCVPSKQARKRYFATTKQATTSEAATDYKPQPLQQQPTSKNQENIKLMKKAITSQTTRTTNKGNNKNACKQAIPTLVTTKRNRPCKYQSSKAATRQSNNQANRQPIK